VKFSSAFVTPRFSFVDVQSVPDLSALSDGALNDLLSSESFVLDNEMGLLGSMLALRHLSLVRHIRCDRSPL
jgi:hypothetical protein